MENTQVCVVDFYMKANPIILFIFHVARQEVIGNQDPINIKGFTHPSC